MAESSFVSDSSAPLVSDNEPNVACGRRRHRVLMVCDFFFPNFGGVESHIYLLAQCLLQRGHKVVVLTHAYGDRVGVRYLTNGLKVYYAPRRPVWLQATPPSPLPCLSLPLFRAIVERERIAIVHAHQSFAPMCHDALLHAPTLARRAVFTDHSLCGFADAASIHMNKLLQFSTAGIHAAICVSHTSKENTVLRAQPSLPPHRVAVIPNAVDANNFLPDPLRCPKPPAAPAATGEAAAAASAGVRNGGAGERAAREDGERGVEYRGSAAPCRAAGGGAAACAGDVEAGGAVGQREAVEAGGRGEESDREGGAREGSRGREGGEAGTAAACIVASSAHPAAAEVAGRVGAAGAGGHSGMVEQAGQDVGDSTEGGVEARGEGGMAASMGGGTERVGEGSEMEVVIVVISRLVYRKGADLLVDVIPAVCTRFPKVPAPVRAAAVMAWRTCCLPCSCSPLCMTAHSHQLSPACFPKQCLCACERCGDGAKRGRLEEMRDRHGLHHRVTMLGAVPHSQVRHVLVQGHIFLNSSLTEAFCIAILEAACCGLFVVATRVGGVPEVGWGHAGGGVGACRRWGEVR
ncbi:unnamed protein product [Closterium sp. NIES-54]